MYIVNNNIIIINTNYHVCSATCISTLTPRTSWFKLPHLDVLVPII